LGAIPALGRNRLDGCCLAIKPQHNRWNFLERPSHRLAHLGWRCVGIPPPPTSASLSLVVAGEVQKGAVPRKPVGKPKREIEPGAAPGRGGSVIGNGQPPFIPTDAQREKVVHLIARNLTNDRISLGIGIPLRTLERHFQPELN
jgi:hypothetical protein